MSNAFRVVLSRFEKIEYRSKHGIVLRVFRKNRLVMQTICGPLEMFRTVLLPADEDSKQRLYTLTGRKSVVPLDEYLAIDRFSFKMSPQLMLRCAFWAQELSSYERAQTILKDVSNLDINDDTIRQVTNFIGEFIYKRDRERVEKFKAQYEAAKITMPTHKKKGILYIMTDGAMFNTRHTDSNGSSWRENKLGLVFSSDNVHVVKDTDGKIRRDILKREYICYIGSAEEFKWQLLECAYRNGYGTYEKTIIISDGASWISNMAEELFPDALRILDLFHLKENVSDFAKCKFNGNEKKYIPWESKLISYIEKGDWKAALKMVPKDEKYSNCVNLHDYIYNNRNSMNYSEYKDNGYIVGSGAVESSNKTVLQQRLNISGMRWDPLYAQLLLTLRAKEKSGKWVEEVEKPFMDEYSFQRKPGT